MSVTPAALHADLSRGLTVRLGGSGLFVLWSRRERPVTLDAVIVYALIAAALCVAVVAGLAQHTLRTARAREQARTQTDEAAVSDCLANATVLIDLTDAAMRRRDTARQLSS